jgi:hypothetical protein
MTRRVQRDIPDDQVNFVVASMQANGAQVTKTKQSDGLWTVTGVFPDRSGGAATIADRAAEPLISPARPSASATAQPSGSARGQSIRWLGRCGARRGASLGSAKRLWLRWCSTELSAAVRSVSAPRSKRCVASRSNFPAGIRVTPIANSWNALIRPTSRSASVSKSRSGRLAAPYPIRRTAPITITGTRCSPTGRGADCPSRRSDGIGSSTTLRREASLRGAARGFSPRL